MGKDQLDEIFRICKKIGITSFKQLNYFNENETLRGDNLFEILQNYEKEYDNEND